MKTTSKRTDRLKRWEIVLLLSLAVFLVSGSLALRTQDALADKVVRLHVLANSDSEEDQALKLLVRDGILSRAESILSAAEDRQTAEEELRRSLPELERVAAEIIGENGYRYTVSAELADTEFPTKEYDGFTLPAGEYLALRVIIGEGKGQNWWCVVFPPVCTTAGVDLPVSALAVGFEEEQVRLVTEENEGYVLKLKTVELWERLRQIWDQRK
ncbi:MAG: stage II sporulation protein R [Ruminococcaceae bacterium]|nr:stage II sporulation protein R [Oscillospiraceae bacterium]